MHVSFWLVKFHNEVNFVMRTKWVLGVTVCLGLPLLGQTLGEITGRVSDPSGAGVPNSVLTLTSTATNAARQTDSGNDGFYSFPSVPPGIYNLKSEHPGFKTAAGNNIEVQVQQTVRLDLTLEVGQVSQSVEVRAMANLLQSENATLGTSLRPKTCGEVPPLAHSDVEPKDLHALHELLEVDELSTTLAPAHKLLDTSS